MDVPFRSDSIGDLKGVSVPQVIGALSAEVGERYAAEEARVDESLLSRARYYRNLWRVPSGTTSTAG